VTFEDAAFPVHGSSFSQIIQCPSTNEKICSSSRKAIIVTTGIHFSISRITI
jgi:hypothetical protein